MSLDSDITVYTVSQVAERLQVSTADVMAEVRDGRIRHVLVAGNVRITNQALREFLEDPALATPHPGSVLPLSSPPITWATGQAPFSYLWPDGETTEQFDECFLANFDIEGRQIQLTLGFTSRWSAGMDRRRATVFLGRAPTLYPLVAFIGGNSFDSDGVLASPIKYADGKYVRPGGKLPSGYEALTTTVFRSVVDGPYAKHCMAVRAHRDEHDSMARHAVLRAEQKGLL